MSIHRLWYECYIQLVMTLLSLVSAVVSVQDGKTALHFASNYGYINVIHLLIGAHADLNMQDKVSTGGK